MRSRVKRIFGAMKEEDVDAVVLMNGIEPNLDLSFFYVTDLVRGGIFERCAAVVRRDGATLILTNKLEEESARKAPEARVVAFDSSKERDATLVEELGGAARVGINAAEATHENIVKLQKLVPGVTLVDCSRAIRQARVVKDAAEIDRLRKACKIAARAAGEIPSFLSAGRTELEVAADLNYAMQRGGASGPSFSTIVAFGETSSEPHYAPSARKLKKDSFALFDFGAFFEHYASDITRTFLFGRGSERHEKVYETVRRAQELSLDAVRPGGKGGDVHKTAADFIDKTEFKGHFIHSVGHTVGLSVHDGATLHPTFDLTLEPGMVVTVEPGVYLPGFGGVRIEDTVLVTPRGHEVLTDAAKGLTRVGV